MVLIFSILFTIREHEFSIQFQAFHTAKSGDTTGLAVLISLCSALLHKSKKALRVASLSLVI